MQTNPKAKTGVFKMNEILKIWDRLNDQYKAQALLILNTLLYCAEQKNQGDNPHV